MASVEGSSSCECVIEGALVSGDPVQRQMSHDDTPSTVASDSDHCCPSLACADAFGSDGSTSGSAANASGTATEVGGAEAEAEVEADDEAQTSRQLGPGLYSDDDVRGGSEAG